MTEHGTAKPSEDLRKAAMRRPHLREHLREFKQITGEFPLLIDEPKGEYESKRPNVIYHVGGPIYSHIYGDLGQDTKYYALEPEVSGPQAEILNEVKNRLLAVSGQHSAPDSEAEYDDLIEELLEEVTHVDDGATGWKRNLSKVVNMGRLSVTEETYENIRYRLNRDIVGLGPLEPVMRDPANEDIHVIGPKECHVDHGTYGMLETTVDFGTPKEFDNWLRNMGERIGRASCRERVFRAV